MTDIGSDHSFNKKNIFFTIFRQKYILNLITTFIHSPHCKFSCPHKANSLPYSTHLVTSYNLIERINKLSICSNSYSNEYHHLFVNVRYWSTKSLSFLVLNQLKYEQLLRQLLVRDDIKLPISPSIICNAIEAAPKQSVAEFASTFAAHLMSRYTAHVTHRCFGTAAKLGRLDIICYVLVHFAGVRIGRQPVVEAAASNQLETLTFFDHYQKKQIKESDLKTHYPAAAVIPSDALENTVIFTQSVLDYAVANGSLECINYLCENRNEGCTGLAITLACQATEFTDRHFQAIRIARENMHMNCSDTAVSVLIEKGRLDVLKYMHSQGMLRDAAISATVPQSAGIVGDMEIIRFLVETVKCLSFRLMAQEVCTHGHLDVLAYMLDKKNKKIFGVAIDNVISIMLRNAIYNGHLSLVKLLLAKKSVQRRVKTKLLGEAAINGNSLETLDYLLKSFKWIFPQKVQEIDYSEHSHDFVLRKLNLLLAHNLHRIEWAHCIYGLMTETTLEIFQFFEKNYAPSDRRDYFMFNAVRVGNIQVVKYLFESGYPVHPFAVNGATLGNIETLRYLVEERHLKPLNNNILDTAVESNNIKVIKYLDSKFSDPKGEIDMLSVQPRTIIKAAESRQLEILAYLLDRYIPVDTKQIEVNIFMARCPDILVLVLDKKYRNLFKLSNNLVSEMITEGLLDSLMICLDTYNNPKETTHGSSTIVFTPTTLKLAKSLEMLLVQLDHFQLTQQIINELSTFALNKNRYSIINYLSTIKNK